MRKLFTNKPTMLPHQAQASKMKGKALCALVAMMLTTNAMAQDGPTMGWSSWNTFGVNINENLILRQADAMVSTGLKDVGFNHINIDDGYFGGRDKQTGQLLIHSSRFPNGLKGVVNYIHSKGLKAGIYSDAGRNTCGSMFNGDATGKGVGMYEHDQQDADFFFKELNFDFIKVDFCGGSWYHNEDHLVLDEQARYTAIAQAIRNTGRTDVRMNACRWAYPGTWVDGVAFSWRTTGDIYDGWESVKGILAENLYLSAYSSKGHYNDMDMLEVGRSMTEEEDKTHFGMWCIMNSPLLIGCNLSNIRSSTLALLKNSELIALNQDALYQQAYVAGFVNGCHILVKDIEVLNGKKRAFAVYNPNDDVRQVTVSFKDLDLAGTVRLRDVFARNNVGEFTNEYVVNVPVHGTRIFVAEAETRLERTRYEAETGYISVYQELKNNQAEKTGVYSANGLCSGGYKAEWLGSSEANALEWRNVYSQTGGEYEMTIGFISGENRNITISVNGQNIQTINVNSGGWGTIGTSTVTIQLNKGNNTVKLSNASDWMPDIDYMELSLTKPLVNGSVEVTDSYALGDDIVIYAPTDWAGQTGEFTGLGHTAYERYNSGSIGTGNVLTQTLTGLKNGKYNVTLELAASFTPNRGFECPTGDGLSVAFANNTQENLPVVERTWVSSVQPLTITATVTDGTLKYGIRNIAASGNWYVANVTGISYVSANTDNTYAVSTSVSGKGTLTPSLSNATAGTVVNLTATPASNFQLESLTVTTCTGETVPLNGSSFVMPTADVTVSANFSLNYSVGDDIVVIAPAEWTGQTNLYGGLGHTAYERYNSGSIGTGDVLTQTLTGLKNGVYAVTLELAASYTSGRGFECPTGDGLSVAFANGTQENLPVEDRGWVDSIEPVTLYAVVTDGTLQYGIRNLKDSGNWYVANVTGIVYESESTTLTHELTVTNAGVSTLYLPYDAAVPDADFFVVATVKEISGSTALLKEIRGDVIPANTGVLIFANAGTYTLSLSSTSSTEHVMSLLHGVSETTSVQSLSQQEGKSIYVLSRGTNEYIGFKKATGSSVKTIPAYKAYLPYDDAGESKFISFSFGGDDALSIDLLKNPQENPNDIYDLTGRKVITPKQGIYIVNGKKTLYK